MNFKNLILSIIFTSTIWACPYCAGQSGGSYVQQVILPIIILLLSPFVIMASVTLMIYLNRNK